MFKSFVIKAYLASVLIQQVIGSSFFIVQVDRIKRDESRPAYWVNVHYYEQDENPFNKTLIDICHYSRGHDKVLFNEVSDVNNNIGCELENKHDQYMFASLLGVGNEYLTNIDISPFGASSGYSTIPCIRTDNNYKFTTYTCGDLIPKDLIDVPKNLPNPISKPTATTTISKPTSTSISSSSSSTTTKSSSSIKPTSTIAPICKSGYCGKKAGNGPTGACCSSSDDCLDTCNSNGKCGVSDETGEPKKATCPV